MEQKRVQTELMAKHGREKHSHQMEELKRMKREMRGELEMLRTSKKGLEKGTKGNRILGMHQGFSCTEQSMLDRVAASDVEMRRMQVNGGVLYNYKSGEGLRAVASRHSSTVHEMEELMLLLGECRGLVLQEGQVVSRPVQRFHRVSEIGGWAATVTAEVVTEKLDGQMMCGVVQGNEVQLWTRGGWTGAARAATKVARESTGVLQLVNTVWEQGGSPTFEFIGRQSRVKVRYGEAELVLVAVRDRVSGRWWQYEMMEQLCERYGAKLVQRHTELEGRTMREIRTHVEGWTGKEGVVVWLRDDCICKVKSSWWLESELKERRRWVGGGTGQDDLGKLKRRRYTETRGQRLVLRGWDSKVCPALALGWFEGACKVEALYRRSDGGQGTVVLGFEDEGKAKAIMSGRLKVHGMSLWAEHAYSGRCRSDEHKFVRTWWRKACESREWEDEMVGEWDEYESGSDE